jgi:hypothetical protein
MTTVDSARGNDFGPAVEGPIGLASLVPLVLGLLADDDHSFASIKQTLRQRVTDDPIDALLTTVIGGGLAFYAAERETNPACATPLDGILYIATCLSVGYDNVFPTTQAGHALAALVQTFGPALAGMAFDAPAAETRAAEQEAAAVNRAILARLEDIVRLLEARP